MRYINKHWLVAVVLCATPTFGMDGIIVPVNPFQKPIAPSNEASLETATCTQFTGLWQGACDGLDGKKDLEMKIDQTDCQTLRVDGTSYQIDGMESVISNQGAGMSTGSTVLSWDPEKTKITGSTQAIGQVLGKRRIIKYQYKNKFTMEKEGAILVLSTEVQADTFLNDLKKVNKGDVVCRLEKKLEETKIK